MTQSQLNEFFLYTVICKISADRTGGSFLICTGGSFLICTGGTKNFEIIILAVVKDVLPSSKVLFYSCQYYFRQFISPN
jgi:hypothetical protein